ncbi:MBL fold metallo-hydrolase [Desulfotruncus alcoholivorax]|uniref:MBL fold metallo-hydrolase n=1 Tax=Desulfotruncus alcoholivorax TaxID=265477 RepID=UPI0003FF3D7A|nr:MBL fold metallo-hydrolase [Desulfotruncus alcoholivorax]
MKLNKITENVYYIDSAVNIGLIVNEANEALLVDTGIDDSVARKVKRLVEENGYKLRGIIITHAHADHCGGAPHLVKTTGAAVYATATEKPVLECPVLEPVYLFGGAYPPDPLHNKFFLAGGVSVDEVIMPGVQNICGCEVEIVDMAGHALGQVGVAAAGVLFCADSVIAPEVIDKHGIPLNADLAGALETFNRLESRQEKFYLPAHGTLAEDIVPVVGANRRRLIDTLEFIKDLLESPKTVEEILAAACSNFKININNMGQYYLMHLTIMAYLSYMVDRKEITAEYNENRQSFKKLLG